ncbi:MAG: hypothetical protein ACXWJK_12295, partial [Burkholderiaceae bacterium]
MENNDTEQENHSLIYLASTNNADTDAFVSTLHQYGYEIKSFHQADDLAKAISEQEPHALILDCDADQGQLAETVM